MASKAHIRYSRRAFLTGAAAGLLAGTGGIAHPRANISAASTVSLATGDNRREMIRRVLRPLEAEIREGVRGRQVVIKANLVGPDPLCATHVDAVRGVLDFLRPIYGKTVIVGDSTGRVYPGPVGTWKHFELHGYLDLPKEYRVKLLDLNDRPTRVLWILDERIRPRPVRIIDTFLDPDVYLISLARLKTHGDVIATLSVKNTVMGAPVSHYRQAKAEGRNEKAFMHAGDYRNIHYNIFLVARHVRPSLSVLDGLVGMEGNGPTAGIAVDHGVALAGMDMVAVDRVGLELMGIPFEDVGYLAYCAQAGFGEGNLANIRIEGPPVAGHTRTYRLHDNIKSQMTWKEEPAANAGR